jgi:hypothetical protein
MTRAMWQAPARLGRAVPDLPRALLQRILAYRIQADAVGDLDPAVVKLLERLGRGELRDIPLPELRAVKPGTLLVREWEGALQTDANPGGASARDGAGSTGSRSEQRASQIP